MSAGVTENGSGIVSARRLSRALQAQLQQRHERAAVALF